MFYSPWGGAFLIPSMTDLIWSHHTITKKKKDLNPCLQPECSGLATSLYPNQGQLLPLPQKQIALLTSGLQASSSVCNTHFFPCPVPTPSSGLSLKAPGSGKPPFPSTGERLPPYAPVVFAHFLSPLFDCHHLKRQGPPLFCSSLYSQCLLQCLTQAGS